MKYFVYKVFKVEISRQRIFCCILEVNNNIDVLEHQGEISHKKRKSEKFEIPPPPKGKTLVDTVIDNDVETLFQVCLA